MDTALTVGNNLPLVKTGLNKQNTIAKVILLLLGDIIGENDRSELREVEVSTFDNCRESGFMYRALNAKQDITFCVYEHRNSDQLIINGCKTENLKSYGAYSGGKWDNLAQFSYYDHYRLAEELERLLKSCVLGTFDESRVEEKE